MRLWILLVAVLLTVAGSFAKASEWGNDLARLAMSGASEEVLLSRIRALPPDCLLTPQDLAYLEDLGVSWPVIEEAQRHCPESDDAGASTESAAEVLVPPPDDLNISFFYDALTPYGRWFRLGSDWCWQPTVGLRDRRWRPYCDRGRWVCTDDGWAWLSGYRWGWAPFHYGRWQRHDDYGWLWTPGTVWAPAWVSWRSGENCWGWAPLPPSAQFERGVGLILGRVVGWNFDFGLRDRDFFFVRARNFCDEDLPVFGIASTQAFRNSMIVENGIALRHGHLIDRGPSVDAVRQQIQRTIPMLTLTDAAVHPGQVAPRTVATEDRLTVFRPAVAASAPLEPPAVQAWRSIEPREPVAGRLSGETGASRESEGWRLAANGESHAAPVVWPSAPAPRETAARQRPNPAAEAAPEPERPFVRTEIPHIFGQIIPQQDAARNRWETASQSAREEIHRPVVLPPPRFLPNQGVAQQDNARRDWNSGQSQARNLVNRDIILPPPRFLPNETVVQQNNARRDWEQSSQTARQQVQQPVTFERPHFLPPEAVASLKTAQRDWERASATARDQVQRPITFETPRILPAQTVARQQDARRQWEQASSLAREQISRPPVLPPRAVPSNPSTHPEVVEMRMRQASPGPVFFRR